MDIGILFKMAAIGIIITVICQILKKSDRDDIATLVSIVGLVIVLAVVVGMVGDLFQQIKTIFRQLMLPATMRHVLPPGLIGLFAMMIVLFILSSDDSRIYSASSTLVQDCVVPFYKNENLSPEKHIFYIKSDNSLKSYAADSEATSGIGKFLYDLNQNGGIDKDTFNSEMTFDLGLGRDALVYIFSF